MNEIRQYLLGVLPEEAQQRVEKRLLTEDAFFEELLVGENELIDLYLSEDLSSEDRDRFEKHFLSTPERHQQLRFAKTLSRYISERRNAAVDTHAATPSVPAQSTVAERVRAFWGGHRWALSAALALAVVVIIAGTSWWFFRPRTFATLTLAASVSNRAEGVQAAKVKLPLAASTLRIILTLPAGATPAAHYRVEWSDDNGEIKPLTVAGQDAQTVSVEIPSNQLARGQYVLKLFMADAAGKEQRVNGSYFFTVE